MLLKHRHYDLFESYDNVRDQFKARTDLSQLELEQVLRLDKMQMRCNGKHLISNLDEIEKLLNK